MRIRCPACAAPYFPQPELPPEEVRCPNCDAPAPPPDLQPKARAVPVREPVGRSRVVNVIALIHFLMAASGLILFVGMSAIVGEHGADPISAVRIVFGAGWAVAWGAVGVGVLRRWRPAWVAALVLSGCAALLTVASAPGKPLAGAACQLVLCVAIVSVLIARRDEFR